jgi:hypothetical protein
VLCSAVLQVSVFLGWSESPSFPSDFAAAFQLDPLRSS